MSASNLIDPSASFCPHCGGALPADASGACPRCLLQAAMVPTEPQGEAAPVPDLATVREAFPQLEILELVGQGGMGWVFKARQPKLDRWVALKLLPASLAERDTAFAGRFEREGQLLARLHHPNIVAVHDGPACRVSVGSLFPAWRCGRTVEVCPHADPARSGTSRWMRLSSSCKLSPHAACRFDRTGDPAQYGKYRPLVPSHGGGAAFGGAAGVFH